MTTITVHTWRLMLGFLMLNIGIQATLANDAPFSGTAPGREGVLGEASTSLALPRTTATMLFEAALLEEEQGTVIRKGGLLATLEGNDLQLTIFFSSLRRPWGQIDLFLGQPDEGGLLIENLALAAPNSVATGGGTETTVSLTDAQVLSLNEGRLFLRMIMLTGDPAHTLNAQIEALPVVERHLASTRLSQIWQGLPTTRGSIRATLEGSQLRLVGYFAGLPAVWERVDLFHGVAGTPGQLIENLLINFLMMPDPSMGFDRSFMLTEEQVQALRDGLLYVEVRTVQLGNVARGQLLAYPNRAPEASSILSPPDGDVLIIGGMDGADPVDPETPLTTITFARAEDPDGNGVSYYWQASRTAAFNTSTTFTTVVGREDLTLPLTVADLAAVFDAAWSGFPLPLQTQVTFHHRMITSDGAVFTFGEAATLALVRGTITSNEDEDDLPHRFTLRGNYPNPFNPTTTIVFDLPWRAEVHVEAFDLLGRQVLTYTPGTLNAGTMHSIKIDGSSLPSGTYLYRVSAKGENGAKVATGRMTLIK